MLRHSQHCLGVLYPTCTFVQLHLNWKVETAHNSTEEADLGKMYKHEAPAASIPALHRCSLTLCMAVPGLESQGYSFTVFTFEDLTNGRGILLYFLLQCVQERTKVTSVWKIMFRYMENSSRVRDTIKSFNSLIYPCNADDTPHINAHTFLTGPDRQL